MSHDLNFGERVRIRFPNLYSRLKSIPIIERYYIFQNTTSKSSTFSWLYFLISGRHLSRNGFCLSNYGVWLMHRPDDVTYKFCIDAKYRNGLEKLLHEISEKVIFIDIGANIGVFSLVAAQNPNITAIHSFEPDLENFEYLVKNILRNRATKAIPHQYAISENAGESKLYKITGHSGASRFLNDRDDSLSSFTTVSTINQTYLNSIFGSQSERYFIKIDVEGYEYEVLKTLRKTMFFHLIQEFYIEFDKSLGKVSKVEEFLLEHDFRESNRWGKDSHWDAHWVKNSSQSNNARANFTSFNASK